MVQTFILARARAYFSRIVQERKEGRIGACHDLLLSTGVSTPRTTAAAAEEKETTIQNYAAVLVQTLFRRRRAVRRRQMIIEKRRRKAAITIQRWLRKLKKKWTKKGKGRKGKASKR